MAKLEDVFAANDARVYRVLMSIDMVDSAAMKERNNEAAWLARYGWLYDHITSLVEEEGGAIVKYGDGVLAVFDDDLAAAAINAAIAIQEALADNHRRVELLCSTGIAAGEVTAFEDPQGRTDYIGVVADRASLLASSASPKAVWVDRETIDIAHMRKVESKVGKTLRRSVSEYQGEPQKIWLKGLGPVQYHEIVWDQAAFGVKSTAVTQDVEERSQPASSPTAAPAHRGDRVKGTLVHWNDDKHIGLVESVDGDSYFVGDRHLAGEEIPTNGTTVWFAPLPAKRDGDNPIAACLVALGSRLTGYVVKIINEKPFGFIEVHDDFGNTQELFWYFGHDGTELRVDDFVEFLVGENDRGPQCREVAPVPEP